MKHCVWFSRYTEFGGASPHRPVEDLAFAVALFFVKGGSFVNYYMVRFAHDELDWPSMWHSYMEILTTICANLICFFSSTTEEQILVVLQEGLSLQPLMTMLHPQMNMVNFILDVIKYFFDNLHLNLLHNIAQLWEFFSGFKFHS